MDQGVRIKRGDFFKAYNAYNHCLNITWKKVGGTSEVLNKFFNSELTNTTCKSELEELKNQIANGGLSYENLVENPSLD